jgi:hypothetical protein
MYLRTAADTRTAPARRNHWRKSVPLAIGIGALAGLSYAWFSGSKHSGSPVAAAIASGRGLFFLVPVTLLASTIFLFVRSRWNRREELLSRQLRAEQERWALAVAANPDALYDADLTTGKPCDLLAGAHPGQPIVDQLECRHTDPPCTCRQVP